MWVVTLYEAMGSTGRPTVCMHCPRTKAHRPGHVSAGVQHRDRVYLRLLALCWRLSDIPTWTTPQRACSTASSFRADRAPQADSTKLCSLSILICAFLPSKPLLQVAAQPSCPQCRTTCLQSTPTTTVALSTIIHHRNITGRHLPTHPGQLYACEH